MKETLVTVVGNVVKPPQRKRTASGGVTNFRIASTPQRYDKGMQAWVDKKPLYLAVECWGDLGGNVSHTVSKGDPVVVVGELFTDEWETEEGRRSKVKIRAMSVAPDLSWGVADFRRTPRSTSAAAPADVDVVVDVPDLPPVDGDYEEGSAPLYELDSENAVPAPALH